MEEQMKKLAIFFPGIGYHCDKPLLYYARKLTQECGYEDQRYFASSFKKFYGCTPTEYKRIVEE